MPVINDLFEWVVTSSLHGSILILTILLIQGIFKKWLTPSWRYALWLPLILTFFLPKWDLLPSHYGVSIDSKPAIIQNAIQQSFLTHVDQADSSLATRAGTISKLVNDNESASGESYVPLVWFSVSLVFSIFVLGSFFFLKRQIQLSSRPVNRSLLLRIETLSKSVGLRNPPKVIISPTVNGPAVCGLWRPLLMLSDWFEDELTEDEQNMILGHELMHIRRWDLPINALFYYIVILNWFNPLLWVANYRIGIDREAACDEQVISSSKWNSVEYGKVLINMNSKQNFSGLTLGFVGILNNSHSLRYRIRQIASQRQLNSSFKPFLMVMLVSFVVWGLLKPKLFAAEKSFNSQSFIERISQMGKSAREDSAYIKGLFQKYSKEIEPLKNGDQKIQLNQNLIAGKLSREEYNNFQKNRFGLGESRKGQGLAFFRTNENTYGKLYYTWGVGHKIHIQEVILYDKKSQEKQLKSLKKLVISSAGHADLDSGFGSGVSGLSKAAKNGTYNPDIHCSSWDGFDDARAYLRSTGGGVLLFPVWTPN